MRMTVELFRPLPSPLFCPARSLQSRCDSLARQRRASGEGAAAAEAAQEEARRALEAGLARAEADAEELRCEFDIYSLFFWKVVSSYIRSCVGEA